MNRYYHRKDVFNSSLIKVYATDKDSGEFGTVRYTDLFGPGAGSLQLEPTTGMVRCMTDNHSFDREEALGKGFL